VRNKMIVANWKMNGSLALNKSLIQAMLAGLGNGAGQDCHDVVLAVPSIYLAQVSELIQGSRIMLAAQDISSHSGGAYTGEVSASMLLEFGVRYVLIGHSERRQYHGETDEIVAEKVKLSLAAGITPIVCVGETGPERQDGLTYSTVKRQLAAVIHANGHCVTEIIVAYEPVWAIGTGQTATVTQAEEVHSLLRVQLEAATTSAKKISILYGGSVNSSNAQEFFCTSNIDGALIGGASLHAAEILSIIKYVK
jgi:triosephosphate isomerase (TIM)